MNETTPCVVSYSHERVDDIGLLLGVMTRLKLAEIIDKTIGNHHFHQGLSNGTLAVVWITYILSQGDHRKSTVQDWVERHRQALEGFLGQPFRSVELDDDRLGIVLRRLSDHDAWKDLEEALWAGTMTVVDLEITAVRLDSTTTCGYHTPTPEGIMQLGYSKDHRPDLPQVKLMAAVAMPSGQAIAVDVVAGDRADDPLYVPLISRARAITGRQGLLYISDAKGGALSTRAYVAGYGDYYLCPLARIGETAQEIDGWIDAIVDGDRSAELIVAGGRVIAAGYEFEREVTGNVPTWAIHPEIAWTERVQVVRSIAYAKRQEQDLEARLAGATGALLRLTPAVGKGRRQIRDEATLDAEVAKVVDHYQVGGLLSVKSVREEEAVVRYVGPGRGSPDRPQRTETRTRYQVTDVVRDAEAIERKKYRLGWRCTVTNCPVARLSLPDAQILYRQVNPMEGSFHLLKDRPLGIRPLYVWREDQIVGLTRLLTLALRVLTLIQTQVRQGLAKTQETLSGLFVGQPKKTTDRPTANRLLQAFARAEITLTTIEGDGPTRGYLTPLSKTLVRILELLGLPADLYDSLLHNCVCRPKILRE